MTLVNIRKNSINFFRFLSEFRCSNIFAVTEHTWNQFFVARYLKSFINIHFGSIRRDPWRFFLIPSIYSLKLHFTFGCLGYENYSMRWLCIRGKYFIGGWAYEETISSPPWLSICGNVLKSKNLELQLLRQ